MAKKLRKVSTPPRLLLLELLIPWIVMGLAALVALSLGLNEVGVTVLALGCGLFSTLAVRLWEQKRRRSLARRLHSKGDH